ncbi:MAG: hypothetical protein ABI947_18235 [Chloroflexota bacterium]
MNMMNNYTMFAEQSIAFSCWNREKSKTVEIQLTVRVENSAEQFVAVSTELLFEPQLPEAFQDRLHQRLYDGVHGGIAIAIPHLPLPSTGITVKVLQLRLSPPLDSFVLDDEIDSLGNILETQMMGIVAGLWSGILNLG